MLHERKVTISDEHVDDDHLPLCTNPVDELGGRLLIKYVRERDADRYSHLSGISHFPGVHYLTPTVISPGDLQSVLALPPLERPKWALLLRPEKLTDLYGPRRISGGVGVEYVLKSGFTSDAFSSPKWVLQYR